LRKQRGAQQGAYIGFSHRNLEVTVAKIFIRLTLACGYAGPRKDEGIKMAMNMKNKGKTTKGESY